MPILNEKFYENLDKKIDTIPSREEAEKFVAQAFQPVIDQLKSVTDKVLTPLLAQLNAYIGEANMIALLMNPPTDPMKCIPWINAAVDAFSARINLMKVQIQPFLLQYEAAKEIINGMPSEVAQLQSHFGEKMSEKGWDVPTPTIVFPPLPTLPDIPDILKD